MSTVCGRALKVCDGKRVRMGREEAGTLSRAPVLFSPQCYSTNRSPLDRRSVSIQHPQKYTTVG